MSEEIREENGRAAKRLKGSHEDLTDLSTFVPEKVLRNNTAGKSVFLQGRFGASPAVLLLEKTSFAEENLTKGADYFSAQSVLKKVFQNDIYGNYECFPKPDLNGVKATVICPATQEHVKKYSINKQYLVDETPEIYEKVTLPSITRAQFSLQWVYNILEGKAEADRIVVEDTDPDTGFSLFPDLKWDGTADTLYMLALVRSRDIKSLRDLTGKHLPLLRNVRDKATEAIKSKYGVDSSQLRVYFHYQPSFYHLHVHFMHLRHDGPGITAESAHLLTNVISNIELLADYYQRATLQFRIHESRPLFADLQAYGLFQ